MERTQALMLGLALLVIGWGIWVGQPAYFSNNSAQQEESKYNESRCFPALFSFGSSVADTGAAIIALPSEDREKEVLYGSTFFGKESKRWTDGRMHIDFWAMALKIPFLDPYLKSVGSNFRRGVNFAYAGSTARPVSQFHLSVQLMHFRDFKHDVLAILEEGPVSSTRKCDIEKVPLKEYFRDGLYMLASGSNDINAMVFALDLSFQEMESQIPEISNEIARVVERLYAEGARNILVEDVYPVGCTSFVLTALAGKYLDQRDNAGCVKPFNDLVQLHNALLKKRIAELGKRLPDASIAVVNTYSRRYDIIANHDQYGFKGTLAACCGAGGPYNVRRDCMCGCHKMENGVLIGSVCNNVSNHIMWDGGHFTDAFNHATMKAILKGDYFEPSFDLVRNGCNLVEI